MPVSVTTHRKALTNFSEKLAAEGYVTQLAWTGETDIPYDALIVLADSATIPEHKWRLELAFLPALDQNLTDAAILQCFAAISVGIAVGVEAELNALITKINTMLPIVGFGFLTQNQTLFFKYNAFLPSNYSNAANQLICEIVPMIVFLLDNFGNSLFEVANGQKTGSEILNENPFASVYQNV